MVGSYGLPWLAVTNLLQLPIARTVQIAEHTHNK